jgi:glutamate---cysteine ligase / carboxylate-amine ligase
VSGPVIRGLAEGRTVRSVGVEEELLIVEPVTGRPRALASAVIRAADPGAKEPGPGDLRADERWAAEPGAPQPLEFELQKQQLEIETRPCHSLDELSRELRRCRAGAAAAAARAGVTVAALGTSPVAVHPEVVQTSRYQAMAEAFGLTAQEQLTCGCHVHVGISSAEEGIAVLDRIQPWLATLLALSANSPFWQGVDSAYASFRYQAWGRWPCSGPTDQFGSVEAYQATVQQMIDTETLLDAGMVYFDARLSQHYPTIEVRIADVCQHAEDAVLIAALTRGLVETEARNWRAGRPDPPARTEQLRLARWRASRSGLDDVLINPVTFRPDKATAVTGLLVEHVRDALADAGDTLLVADLLDALLRRGNGAIAQRSKFQRRGRLMDVITAAAATTTS